MIQIEVIVIMMKFDIMDLFLEYSVNGIGWFIIKNLENMAQSLEYIIELFFYYLY